MEMTKGSCCGTLEFRLLTIYFITDLTLSCSKKEERVCSITDVACPFDTWVVEKELENIDYC